LIYINVFYKIYKQKMIIPVKCFTCGKVLADKYRYYQEEVRKNKLARNMEVNEIIYFGLVGWTAF